MDQLDREVSRASRTSRGMFPLEASPVAHGGQVLHFKVRSGACLILLSAMDMAKLAYNLDECNHFEDAIGSRGKKSL